MSKQLLATLIICLTMGMALQAVPSFHAPLEHLLADEDPIEPKGKITKLTYEKAVVKASTAKLMPFTWYYLTDKKVYLQAATPSQFMLQGFLVDAATGEVDQIQYDFANAHIQQRCDKRGNCVGANFDIIAIGMVSVDPISVFKWGDNAVQDNTVRNAVFNLQGLKANEYGIVSNTIIEHAEVTVSSKDSLFFIKNTCRTGAVWSAQDFTGYIFDNEFSAEISVTMDGASAIVSDNKLHGAGKRFDLTGAKGKYGGNNGHGNISCRNCGPSSTILSANLYDGASIIADTMRGHINAVELHRGSELYMIDSDSAFSKSFLDFTAIVHADGTQTRSEYNRFIGCGNGYGTHFFVAMNNLGMLSNCTFSSCDTVKLDKNRIYNMQVYEGRNVGINTMAWEKLEVKGGVLIDAVGERIKLVGLQKFPNDEAAKKGGITQNSLYINSQTGAITIQQIPPDKISMPYSDK